MTRLPLTHTPVRDAIIAASLWALCATCHAGNDNMYFSDYESFGIEEDGFDKMPILTLYQMDDETLFRAAEAERDNSMSTGQRILNNRWLLDHKGASHSGTEAIRRYLRLFVVESWKARRKHKLQEEHLHNVYALTNKPSQFREISNYRLRVSDDNIRIRFRYRFR